MRKEYDFSKMKSRKNPYSRLLKRQISIKLDNDTIEYFKKMSKDSGIPYQTLINMYLSDCATKHKTLEMIWK
ncbi:MAG: BrnA antitoxin family protein [Spirochaetales bacterium]|nr:BrnA antitoxin family protein [Spirochaetales bacterium]